MFEPFARRIDSSRAWTLAAFVAPRGLVAIVLAVVPALVVLALALASPGLTEPIRVRDAFARYISGLITAATIAVGFATLSLRRGLRGLGELKVHVESDRAYAERVGELTGHAAPRAVGPTLALVLDTMASRARELDDGALARHATEVARRVRGAGGDPDALLRSALDLDSESVLHYARLERRDERLAALAECADIGRSYVRTLATQWGLSRMSQGIALTSIAAVVVATLVVLAYEPTSAAPFVVAGAVATVLLPLAVFVSYALRFTFVNQHSLPLGHFVLGPEDPRAVEGGGRKAGGGGKGRRRKGAGREA